MKSTPSRLLVLWLFLLLSSPVLADFEPQETAVLDTDLDGKPDIVVGAGSTLFVFKGLGGGRFDIGYRVGGAYVTIDSFDVRDLDGDGHPDLLLGEGKEQQVWVASRQGLRLASSVPKEAILWMSRAADLNGDKVPELITQQTSELAVFSQSRSSWKESLTRKPPVDAHHLVVGDLNGDGCDDVVVSLTGSPKAWLWLGQKQGPPLMSLLNLGRPASYAALGDFNGDHKLDLAWGWNQGIGLADGRGDGTFEPPVYLDLGREVLWQGFVVADFDGDGQDDLAGCEWQKQELEIFFSGRGQPGYTAPIARLTVAGCGDYDGDGKPDLLLPYNRFHSVETLHNLGNRQFQPGPTLRR